MKNDRTMPRAETFQAMQTRYEHPAEVEAYAQQVAAGLLPEEEALLNRFAAEPCRVLVLGCGAGREALALSQRSYQVSGVDISQAMVAAARELSLTRGTAANFVWTEDPLKLPFADEAFDLVLGFAQFLAQVPGRQSRVALLAEVRRVLIPLGRLLGSVADRRGFSDLTDSAEAEESVAEEGWEEGDTWVWETSQAQVAEPHFFHLHTSGELAWELKKGGLHLKGSWLGRELTKQASKDSYRYRFFLADRPHKARTLQR